MQGNELQLGERNLGDEVLRLLFDRSRLGRPMISTALAYGRHRGPSPVNARVAAVAVAIYRDRQFGWTIPLTLRPVSLSHHGGQICLPGGRVESGETISEAAIREFTEELGLVPNVQMYCGQLSTQYVYASDNLVHPVVFVIDPPDRQWQPDPIEVDEVVTLPVSALIDSSSRVELIKSRSVRRGDLEIGEFRFRATAIRHEGHEIWGATALILDELAQLLHHSKHSRS